MEFFCREVVELAATRLIALHKNKGKSVAACLKSRTDYAQNPDKTNKGELVSSYECSPLTVDEEFMLSKRQYELVTGRRQKSDVIAYQIRQSFKPGEITAEEANKVGYELAMRFTKGKYVALRFYGFSQPSQIDLSLPYDIALLDIDMGETNGIELARKLRAENENIVIIFITNFIQYAPEGFEVQAFRYLLKADLSAKLDSYFDSAVQEVLQRKQLVTISINSEIIDVPVNDILYLESHRRIIVMHLLDEKRPAYQFYGNITELSEKIEPLGFLRIQKSYLVNMHYVEIFQYNKVQLRGGLCLAPSEKNYSELKQKYLHWRGKSRWML